MNDKTTVVPTVASAIVIGQHGADAVWLNFEDMIWTTNIFAATKFYGNDGPLAVTKLKQQGANCYAEPLPIAARRYHELTQSMRKAEA